MTELDLIPQDYRQLQRARIQVKLFTVILIMLLIAIVIGKLLINGHVDELGETISNFEQKGLLIHQQQHMLADLEQKKLNIEERVNILRSLRDGPSAKQMFQVIDQALVEGTWFKRWSFKHDGELSDANNSEEINTGYFIIIKDEKNPARKKKWQLNTHMEISGEALNHTVLAGLVNNFVTSPEIDDVRILNTSLIQYTTGELVDFNLAIVVNDKMVN